MKRLNYIFVLIGLFSTLMVGCSSLEVPNQPPEISIKIGDNDIEYVIGKNKWDNAVYDKEDTFQTILKVDSGIEIPYIEIGDTAKIDFMNYPPDDINIQDHLLNEDGKPFYSKIEGTIIPIEIKNGKGSFEINQHMATSLSSTYIVGKTNLRGFRIIATWGDNECEYGFVIRTGDRDRANEVTSEESRRIELYTEVLTEAFLEENGGDSFVAVKLETLEGLGDAAKLKLLDELTTLSSNVYNFEEVKNDTRKFVIQNDKDLIQSINGTLLWVELEEYTDKKATITGVSWFGNMGAVFPTYEATYINGKWKLKLISMAIS